ncbi:DUF4652 domain-containing protein [Alkalihalobacillus oceani]|uniref:DUF4652 domain-containing protein n=1 Tax=Halalkalibacter oceani TaxID=1653776 RepID=A0A9X2DSF5_9BACI|nr:DUF4652 domain-containing protein [Halalkalibacter oceani]MCM3716184.1 DUF4652 domain-containing protein [Halalkalibacter oceani]MCM3761773.1 DUF4652 domain-containing protein [Halalkalibacter oceani]
MFDIKFNSKTETVELVYPNGNTEVLAEDSPTEPVVSADKKKAVYISPLEWEERGNLYIVDLQSGEQEVLVAPEGDYIPKNAIWQDNKRVLVIIGYGSGTVRVGGNIFSVNIETKEKVKITDYNDGRVQILDFEIKDGILTYTGIQYTDNDFQVTKTYSNSISLDSLMSY